MGRLAKTISLRPREQRLMQQEVNRKKIQKQHYLRIQIILKSNEGLPNKEIAPLLGCNVKTVSHWRSRWHMSSATLDEFEKGEDGKGINDKTLMNRILFILSDNPRPGHGSLLSESDLLRLQALACESPEDYGLPFSTWTHVELSNQAKRMGIQISPSWYGVILKKRLKTT